MLDRKSDLPSPQAGLETASRPVSFRGGGFTPRAGRYSGWIALALVIGLWQLAGSAGWVNPLFLPAPSAIAVAIYKLAVSGALWHHLSVSIMRIRDGVDSRDARRRHRRLFDRALEFRARRRHHLHLGAVSDSKDRAIAAVDPVARDRRGTEDRHHRVRRVFFHRDLGL